MTKNSIFILQHERECTDGENVKMIGVYTSRKAAEAAVGRLHLQPGFSDFPDGFCIDEYPLDKNQRAEGFDSV